MTIVRQSARATAPKRKNTYYSHKVFDASNIDEIEPLQLQLIKTYIVQFYMAHDQMHFIKLSNLTSQTLRVHFFLAMFNLLKKICAP